MERSKRNIVIRATFGKDIWGLESIEIFNLQQQADYGIDHHANEEMKHLKRSTDFLNFVNSTSVSVNLESSGYTGDLTTSIKDNTDLVPGVYEGGLKIWECSEDLVRYLYHEYSQKLNGSLVLEVGCGAGLPGVYAFASGATVHFNDYNQEVLEEVTIPNVLLNVKSNDAESTTENDTKDCTEDKNDVYCETRYISGDWAHLDTLLTQTNNDKKYDLILASETIYNPQNYDKLINLFKHHLKPELAGVALIAAKTYYFGVGGGIKDFQARLESEGFLVETVKTFESGVKRQILAAKLN